MSVRLLVNVKVYGMLCVKLSATCPNYPCFCYSLLFELVGLPPETAAGYRFTSVEIKEKAFRFDGIFIPDLVDKNIWFVEVQFQKRAEFYWESIGEIFLYLSQYQPEHDW